MILFFFIVFLVIEDGGLWYFWYNIKVNSLRKNVFLMEENIILSVFEVVEELCINVNVC